MGARTVAMRFVRSSILAWISAPTANSSSTCWRWRTVMNVST